MSALTALIKDDSIIIRPSDKGQQVVLFNADDYANQIEQHLQDCNIYKQTDPITPTELKQKIDRTLNKLTNQGKISNQMASNMRVRDVQLAKVQGNPKTHKEGNELRLIVNSRMLPTTKIAEYVEE